MIGSPLHSSPFNTLLIANRGEIACRIMRTARTMGLRTVAVHSDTDAQARHVREADQAVNLGGSRPGESYLRIERIVQAALDAGAQAVHPGYGFLSENADFARAVEAAGLIFLGPPAAAIDAMGSKSAAKRLMAGAGVPLVPGYHGAEQSLPAFREAAAAIGYPVLLKASFGGGGKGMKVVECEADLAQALASAQREAHAAFGDQQMLLEKYLLAPRHVEIQVFADRLCHCLYLNERDCSIQRRHQKVIEEAPAPGLSAALRQTMGEAAVRAAQAIGYVGAGTVEFLLDARGEFFFMEMNTRLQVEHPVTEAITGLDLVQWQLQVAAGQPLALTQADVPLRGHAIEVRLYAEDPDNDFLPSSGTLHLYREAASGAGRRIDSAVEEGDQVSPFYDPLLAKIIAWGDDREQARQRLLAMLGETFVGGVKSNLAFLKRLVAHPAFVAGELDTGFITRHQAELLPARPALDEAFWQMAGAAWLASEAPSAAEAYDPWTQLRGLRLGAAGQSVLSLQCGDLTQRVALSPVSLTARPIYQRRGRSLYLQWHADQYEIGLYDALDRAAGERAGQRGAGLSAPMSGSVVRVLVEVGQVVAAGAALVVMEAMKMEHSVRAPQAGTVKALLCAEGDSVSEGTVLIAMEDEP